ncbi:MAG: MmcQ/YjbR family DNA-binding protein [Archangium sp.]
MRNEIPSWALEKVRLFAMDLPEAKEERAWAGVRWVVGKKNFAHVVFIERNWPPAYAEAMGGPGPACVLTFRVPKEQVAPRFSKRPFFKPVWFANIVGLVLDEDTTDWDEVSQFVRASYRVLAPKKLAARVEL